MFEPFPKQTNGKEKHRNKNKKDLGINAAVQPRGSARGLRAPFRGVILALTKAASGPCSVSCLRRFPAHYETNTHTQDLRPSAGVDPSLANGHLIDMATLGGRNRHTTIPQQSAPRSRGYSEAPPSPTFTKATLRVLVPTSPQAVLHLWDGRRFDPIDH